MRWTLLVFLILLMLLASAIDLGQLTKTQTEINKDTITKIKITFDKPPREIDYMNMVFTGKQIKSK